MRFPRISPVSLRGFKISRGGRNSQERQRQIEIGQEELDTNPVRVANNTPYAMQRLEPHDRAIVTVLAKSEFLTLPV
jgi:hypothetical protein